jgi:hypothetical protein
MIQQRFKTKDLNDVTELIDLPKNCFINTINGTTTVTSFSDQVELLNEFRSVSELPDQVRLNGKEFNFTRFKSTSKLQSKFMQMAIQKINDNSAAIYAIAQILVEKKIITQKELSSKVVSAKKLPEQNIGKKVLDEMIAEYAIQSKQPT